MAKSADEAVERVLQFERNWAGFELPKFLVAFSSIQEEVLGRLGFPTGDYRPFASQVETLFRPPVVAALDEYGIPIQVAEKLRAHLGTKDDLDVALRNLLQLDVTALQLTRFEAELVKDAQKALLGD